MEPSIKVNMNYLKNLPCGTHSDQEIDTKDKTVNPVPMEKFIEPILKRVGLPPEKITEFDLMELQKTEKRQESHSPNDVSRKAGGCLTFLLHLTECSTGTRWKEKEKKESKQSPF